MKILIVEDDKNLNNTMAEALKGFADVVQVFDGEEALFQAEQNIFDLIILDVMLPYADGFTILETIRKNSNVPVLMVTAKTMVEDRVKGLNLGADDYLTKPFYRDELVARVEALLRRYNNNFEGLKLTFKDLEFDIVHKIVRINGENINLNGKIYDILEYLIRNKDIIIPKEQLFNRIWGFESDTVWSVVEVYVSNLRKVLKEYDYAKYLKTVRNVGYMWSEKD
ncbi:MAG TPA: response regulator transcription factor [Acholeplasma sp.]|jgi:two-component system response regulator CiaR|nr:response regulator transcription factor [Acholeplasma sp.]